MKKIKSLSEYCSAINEIQNKWKLFDTTMNMWYRGQSNTNYRLLPKIYRNQIIGSEFEREMVRDFKLYSQQFIDSKVSTDIESLFIMQHYGMPTRLLDWTESSLVALYFCVKENQSKSDGVVWTMNPWILNSNILDVSRYVPSYSSEILKNYIINIDSENFERTVTAKTPLAFRPLRNNQRIIAQKGMFVIFGNESKDLEEINSLRDESFLNKIIVDKNYKKKILKELFYSGISESVIFPDIEGLCKEIEYRYSETFYKIKPKRTS